MPGIGLSAGHTWCTKHTRPHGLLPEGGEEGEVSNTHTVTPGCGKMVATLERSVGWEVKDKKGAGT